MSRPIQSTPKVQGVFGDRIWGRLLFSVDRKPITCTKERQEVAIGGASVDLWLESSPPGVPVRQPALVVLRLLGSRGRAELATRDPVRFLPAVTTSVTAAMNPPGFGRTRGPCALSMYFAGVIAAYDSIGERFPESKIWVYGKSIGGLGALYLAATRSPRAIVVRNVVDVPGIAAERVGSGVRAVIPSALDAQRWAAFARCPALFVVSSADRLAKPMVQNDVVAAYGGKARFLEVSGAHDDRELSMHDCQRYAAALARLLDDDNGPTGSGFVSGRS